MVELRRYVPRNAVKRMARDLGITRCGPKEQERIAQYVERVMRAVLLGQPYCDERVDPVTFIRVYCQRCGMDEKYLWQILIPHILTKLRVQGLKRQRIPR